MAARGEPPFGDNELRNELKRLGYTPGPVTATTRPLLLKKLERLKEEEKKEKRKKPPASKVSSTKILAFSSEESDGESARNSRGTAPVIASRRRSVQPRPAPSTSKTTKKTTKRHSLGSQTSQTARKSGSRRSLAVPTESNDSDDSKESAENNLDDRFQASSSTSSRNNQFQFGIGRNQTEERTYVITSSKSRTPLGGTSRRSLRVERGAGETKLYEKELASRGEFSDSDEEQEVETRHKTKSVRNKAKSKATRISRTHTIAPISSRLSSKSKSAAADDEVDDVDEENGRDDESGRNDSERREMSKLSSVDTTPKEGNLSGRWSFLTRRKITPHRQEENASPPREQDNDGNSTNWSFFTSRFNASGSRTSTPRKSRSSEDDTLYHSIAGNSTRQDVFANEVAAPVSGRPSARGVMLDASPTNHASFLGETPSTESSAPRHQERTHGTSNQNRSFVVQDAQMVNDQSMEEAQIFATEENLVSSWRTKYGDFMSRLLLGAVFLFFVVLALMYLSVNRTETSGYLNISDLAGGDDIDFSGDEVPLQMVQALHVKLSEMTGNYQCGKSEFKNMSLEEAKIYLQEDVTLRKKQQRRPFWMAENLPRTLHLITENKHWGLRLYRDNGELIQDYDFSNEVVWLDSSRAHMSLFCQVKTTFLNIFFWLSVCITAFLILWPVYMLFKYQRDRKHQERQEVTNLVDKIIEMLVKHQQACYKDQSLPPYLAIPHVRDALIPPAERHKNQALWDKAVQFLNVNESRVRVETQQISGEEFAVWRWVQPSPAVAVTSFSPITERDMNPKRNKVWQGTAFPNLDSAVKASAYSYTPCLKVRNMFDPTLESGPNWEVTIQDAILERCGETSGILHVAVDKNSREGCVYVKLVSAENAGVAFRCLHGSWFDGRLVTVKYIRLDRYHQRFPSALSANTPMHPSNNLRLSLQPMPSTTS